MTQPAPSRRHAIAEDLRNQISKGLLKAGARLPSEAQLAAHYAVSTPTLRNALALLQSEGLVEKIHGSGNFVRHPLRRITYAGGERTPCADDALHTTVRATRIRAHGHLTALLKVRPRSPLTEFLCLSHEGESPHSLTRIYVPRDLTPPGSPGESLAAHHADLRPLLATVQETVSTRLPTPDEATTLRIGATLSVLSITRVSTAITGRVVEAALLVLPGDRADAIFTTHYTTAPRRADA
ncbi:GntR family transcriptional regulator [Streptomyces sp. NPDC054797]